ncbi:endothelin-converting enzyme Metallo peptidase. MEROPS family M13 [Granulicella rosea]|uniref:Endothelin-converting enzyme Metallo peptidase. MEROPS family M13 n=1 Tax=Granulicella rosea TaxID=474952 RepID=A0A239MCH0_9BACT|nr:M13 family metallopeptidase [Granulicella rosea]SNT39728.1 endothelin-converting enzyme Metallo peptidase. MEROPS family M13 [Granulicella rosea]
MNPRIALPAFALCLLALPLCAQTAPETHGVAVANMDKSVKPGDDFYRYANGAWLDRTVIPADRTSIGSFSLVANVTDKRVAGIVAEAAAHPERSADDRKMGDLYKAYMDAAAVDARGLAPIKPYLEAIAAIKTQKELAHALGLTLRADVDALNATNFHTMNLFGVWVAPGFNDPDHYAPYLMQGGLSLPDQAYYLTDSPRMKTVRAAHEADIAALLKLAGYTDTEARAAKVVALETAIAKTHTPLAENEDIHKANNTWTMADFPAKAPGLDWATYFKAAGLDTQKSFIVWQPTAFTGEAALVAGTPLDVWKDYLAFHLIYANAGVMPAAFANQRFSFTQVLTGAPQQRPREQRAVAFVNGMMGDAVGKDYAKLYFSPEEKAKVQQLVQNLIDAFHVRLTELTWMAPATKAEAIRKLGTLKVSVGYPDTWRSYAGLEIKADDLFGDVQRAGLFDLHYELSRIGKPVDRSEWCMEPQTVNAVNLPLDNGLNFPAAILQPPFYDPKAPDAYNYGAIGSVIGHEISHTFDSEGAAFDSEGRVRNWWTPEDLAHFNASTAALAAQYDKYQLFPDVNVNGKQTLGENIADTAGLTVAYDAYHAALKGKPAPVVDGLTGDQQFFLAFAQNWGTKAREASLRQQVATDPHAPAEFRAATVRNLDAWYAAFPIQPANKLYLAPADRVHIW